MLPEKLRPRNFTLRKKAGGPVSDVDDDIIGQGVQWGDADVVLRMLDGDGDRDGDILHFDDMECIYVMYERTNVRLNWEVVRRVF